MTNFKKNDVVCIVKLRRIPHKRIGLYRVDIGIVINTIEFPSRKVYYVQCNSHKNKYNTWLNEKYLFTNLDDAKEYANKLNEKLKINRDAREKVKKLYEN